MSTEENPLEKTGLTILLLGDAGQEEASVSGMLGIEGVIERFVQLELGHEAVIGPCGWATDLDHFQGLDVPNVRLAHHVRGRHRHASRHARLAMHKHARAIGTPFLNEIKRLIKMLNQILAGQILNRHVLASQKKKKDKKRVSSQKSRFLDNV